MSPCRRPFCIAVALVLLAAPGRAGTSASQILPAAESLGLRTFDSGANVTVLTFETVKPALPDGFEDRNVMHFAMDDVAIYVSSAVLEIAVSNLDDAEPLGAIELHAFAGDGVVSADEWDSGTLIHTFDEIGGGVSTLSVDVSGLFQQAEQFEVPFLSFRLRGLEDRFFLGAGSAGADVALVLAPEPASAAMLVTGAAVLALRRRVGGPRHAAASRRIG
jgi:hypothetical protein